MYELLVLLLYELYELGNILLFENGENFFNNSRFSVEQSEFKVRAKLKDEEA